ncbi:MAG: hypothetical protein ACRERD_01700 [Candidatus Binatia bacterium]
MKTHLTLTGDAKTLNALARFLREFEKLNPAPVSPPTVVRGEDNVVYVEAGYKTDEETFLVADHMAQVGADIVEETDVLVALAPFIGESCRTPSK